MSKYETFLADYEAVLPQLATLIGATYSAGTFEFQEHELLDSELDAAVWQLRGDKGALSITFEKYEGYFHSVYEANGSIFEIGKKLLTDACISQGGKSEK